MSFYISVRGVLMNCQFDSKRAADQHAQEVAIDWGIPLTDVLVIKANGEREARNKSAKHFG